MGIYSVSEKIGKGNTLGTIGIRDPSKHTGHPTGLDDGIDGKHSSEGAGKNRGSRLVGNPYCHRHFLALRKIRSNDVDDEAGNRTALFC